MHRLTIPPKKWPWQPLALFVALTFACLYSVLYCICISEAQTVERRDHDLILKECLNS